MLRCACRAARLQGSPYLRLWIAHDSYRKLGLNPTLAAPFQIGTAAFGPQTFDVTANGSSDYVAVPQATVSFLAGLSK